MLSKEKVTVAIGADKAIELGTGKIARLANGSCVVRQGDTTLLVAACSGPPRPGMDFFPLQVDYREKYSAAGKFPGGYIKREGRPSTKEILTCRVTDRPLRPLFPKGFFNEVQVQALLLSADGENEPDTLCMLGASAALCLSDLPFQGPIGALRVGYIDGQFVANPNNSDRAKSEIDLIYAGLPDKVIMIEGEARECSEEMLADAMAFANEIVKKQVAAQLDLMKVAGRAKVEPTLQTVPEQLAAKIAELAVGVREASLIAGKEERQNAQNAIFELVSKALPAAFPEMDESELAFKAKLGFDDLVKKTIRNAILNEGYRPDGRGIEDLRPISAEVGCLPVVHGSGLFSRGETQALVISVLGGPRATQDSDSISGGEVESKRFYLHYNFPNYSVGECGRIMGPGRREIGHGDLAERSVAKVVPEDFPYTIRCVSEVMASNGSTSMASVCGAILSLMDAGVPIKAPVAGISCGLVTGDGKELLLTDILGAEDHFGDMDFKVCGTREGITGFQLDLKLPGISLDLLGQAMERNRVNRLKILDVMGECISTPRADISPNAPQIKTIMINPDKIGAVIGTGGKTIREICETTGAEINIEDDGSVLIMAGNAESMNAAVRRVEELTAEVEVGQVYRGKVVTVKDFGAFVEVLPGQEGLLHISELADYRVGAVTDICNEGDMVTVKVLDVDQSGKMRLSRRAALEDMAN